MLSVRYDSIISITFVFNSFKSILQILLFILNKISRLQQTSLSTSFRVSFITLLTLFLKTALPVFLLIINPILKLCSLPGPLTRYIVMSSSFLQGPFLINLKKSSCLLIVWNLIIVFLFNFKQKVSFFLFFFYQK